MTTTMPMFDLGLTVNDIFNDSPIPQTKQEYLAKLEEKESNESRDFSEVYTYDQEEVATCCQSIDELLADMRTEN